MSDTPFPLSRLPQSLSLSARDVHVWQAALDLSAPELASLSAVLSAEEHLRAGRLLVEAKRRQFIAARGILRSLLAAYLRIPPREVQIAYGERGKPFLAEEQAASGLQFNLAHSRDLALFAFSLKRQLGIDLEYTQGELDHTTIRMGFFAPGENARLEALPEHLQVEAFFNCWTRKEAYLKAAGDGLRRPLEKFEVAFEPGQTPRLLSVQGDPAEVERWAFHAWEPAPGYTAALVVEGHSFEMSIFSEKDAGRETHRKR